MALVLLQNNYPVFCFFTGNDEKKIGLEMDVISADKASKVHWCGSGRSCTTGVVAQNGKVKWSGVSLKRGEDLVLILGK